MLYTEASIACVSQCPAYTTCRGGSLNCKVSIQGRKGGREVGGGRVGCPIYVQTLLLLNCKVSIQGRMGEREKDGVGVTGGCPMYVRTSLDCGVRI